MSKEINFKINKDLCEEAKEIAQNKFPLRKIEFYSDAIREAIIEFIKKNQRYKNKETKSKNTSIKPEAST